MGNYINSQRPKTISAVIHHTMVASKINFQQGGKKNFRAMDNKDQADPKPKTSTYQHSAQPSNNKKKKPSKGKGYKGKIKLSPEELERYQKESRCYRCGEKGHLSRTFPKRNERSMPPRASTVETMREGGHGQGSALSYAWGKVKDHDAFILFDPGSTHNFISTELAMKLGIHDFEMGEALKADGAFKGQEVSVTPLIGKLRLHVQGYVDKEDFFISPLKHEDVILGTPWFDRMAATMKFFERKILFSYRGKEMAIDVNSSGRTIPLVDNSTMSKAIKSSLSCYMIFVKRHD